MLITTETDGASTNLTVEIAAKYPLRYTVTARQSEDGSALIVYENADGEEYTLLEIAKDGAIITESPKQ
jgi:hypothetical protein